ncbi:MAG: peptidase M2 family protein [Acidobacteria bacterium]|nr:MAG: peptidase M2 family protein [Acidobacteriota bacterium]
MTRHVPIPQMLSALLPLLLLAGCAAPAAERGGKATAAEASAFLDRAEADLSQAQVKAERAGWVQATYITYDTEIIAAEASRVHTDLGVELATAARRFDGLELPYDEARKLKLLKLALTLPAPSNEAESAELAQVAAQLQSMYGSGKYCPEGGGCRDLTELSRTMAESRNPAELLEAWRGWRTVSPAMKPLYERYVELGNKGARELGFADLGEMWRSKYDMEPDAFAAELDRLWQQVAPLYEALHCHVRAELNRRYGDEVVDPAGPIPAHLLGNMWAQTWANVYDLVAPAEGGAGYDLTELLRKKGLDEVEMVRYGERFFTSLGFDPLPETFWQRSLFKKPRDREVVCHASAWDIDNVEDLRIKMCIEINAEDFSTIHHELGHNFYQRAYNHQPPLYRDSANDGFHEAVGDTIALSVTPSYLVQIGLLDREPPPDSDLGYLLRMALDKIAFLPFGLLVDQWRWKVFSGELTPAQYNDGWWQLRRKYQGVDAPIPRAAADFDPGAKYHVPSGTPYSRYFLAHILQFQFHRALCRAAGYDGPLHRCSIYGSEEAGKRLQAMLAMGLSRPWPEALEALTGQREMDATAIVDYFRPLLDWLEEQNAGRTCGWSSGA